MKLKKSKNKTVAVKVVNDPLSVGVESKPCLVTLFDAKEVSPGTKALGPLAGLDLTGYAEYRLTLHFTGTEGTAFSIREMFGPAGAIDLVAFDVGGGQIGPRGILNYRAIFEVFGPKNLFIQVSNDGHEPFQLNGTLYAVR
ncbi:MAG: hypothetical protein LJE59_11510 [Chromatiaceae bacterium]|nr:hypothetical protein [Chromatiaceae bacterium]